MTNLEGSGLQRLPESNLTFRNNVRDYICPLCGGKRASTEAGITYVCASGHAPAICKEVIRD